MPQPLPVGCAALPSPSQTALQHVWQLAVQRCSTFKVFPCPFSGPLACVQIIRQSLLEDTDASTQTPPAAAEAEAPQPGGSQQQMQQQEPQQGPGKEQQQADALSAYKGGPVFLVTDIKSTGSAPRNIAAMPSAPFLYGVSIGICMSSATSEPGGAGLGTVGWHEVSSAHQQVEFDWPLLSSWSVTLFLARDEHQADAA